MDKGYARDTRPLRNRSRDIERLGNHSKELGSLVSNSQRSFERTKTIIQSYNADKRVNDRRVSFEGNFTPGHYLSPQARFSAERAFNATSAETIDVFRLKDRIGQEFDKLLPEIISKMNRARINIDEHDILVPITEVQNRVNCIVQAMWNNKYKTINPDFSLNEFNVLEQQRVERFEDSFIKYQKLNSARIKKGFIMVNKVFEQLDELRKNFLLYKHNIDARKSIISEIKIEPNAELEISNEQDSIMFASPAVPQKPKSKKRKTTAKSKKRSPKMHKKSVETNTDDFVLKNQVDLDELEKENSSIFANNGILNIQNFKYSDTYAKLIIDFRDKVVKGLSEDSYNLKTFETCSDNIETYLWILKDLFYEGNKELRKTLKDGFNEEYAKEINELEALDTYKTSKEVADVFKRQVKWLKSQNNKLTDKFNSLSKKHKELRLNFKSNDEQWHKLKEENDGLLQIIKELETDFVSQNQLKLQKYSSHTEVKPDLDSMIAKINKIIDEDGSETSSKNSEVYKAEINNLNSVIDTLLNKLQTPSKFKREEVKNKDQFKKLDKTKDLNASPLNSRNGSKSNSEVHLETEE